MLSEEEGWNSSKKGRVEGREVVSTRLHVYVNFCMEGVKVARIWLRVEVVVAVTVTVTTF